MVIAYIVNGMFFGALLSGIGLIAGSPLWSILLLYSFGGSFAVAGLAGLVHLCTRRTPAPDSVSGSAAQESVV